MRRLFVPKFGKTILVVKTPWFCLALSPPALENQATGQTMRDTTPRVLVLARVLRFIFRMIFAHAALDHSLLFKAKRRIGWDRTPRSFDPPQIGGFGQNSLRGTSSRFSRIGVSSGSLPLSAPLLPINLAMLATSLVVRGTTSHTGPTQLTADRASSCTYDYRTPGRESEHVFWPVAALPPGARRCGGKVSRRGAEEEAEKCRECASLPFHAEEYELPRMCRWQLLR